MKIVGIEEIVLILVVDITITKGLRLAVAGETGITNKK
jgi:hypothetical protein